MTVGTMAAVFEEWEISSTSSNGIDIFCDGEEEEMFVNYRGHDPLLISCIQYRLNGRKLAHVNMTPSNKEMVGLLAKATNEDYTLVDDIKAYYTSKYMIRQLQSGSLTSYKSNTLQLFNMAKDSYSKVPSKWVGIAFKLPFFYAHDTSLDKMFAEHSVEQHTPVDIKQSQLTLTYLQSISPYSKKFPDKHFWFKDALGNMYLFKGKTPNPLIGLFEKMIDKHGHVIVLLSGTDLKPKSFFNHSYYELTRVEFEYV